MNGEGGHPALFYSIIFPGHQELMPRSGQLGTQPLFQTLEHCHTESSEMRMVSCSPSTNTTRNILMDTVDKILLDIIYSIYLLLSTYREIVSRKVENSLELRK